MILSNANYVDGEFKLKKGDIRIEDGKIKEIGENLIGEERIDCTGKYVLPGFVDSHFHGACGVKVSNENPDYDTMTNYLATQGVTSVVMSTVVNTRENLLQQVENVYKYKGNENGAKILAVHLEGPFISTKYKGAMNDENIVLPTIEMLDALCERSGNMVKMITIAPEVDGAMEVIKYAVSKGIKVFLGHTGATYEQAKEAINAGASGMTHTFNASVGLHHRNPGVLGATLTDESVSCEMICDYVHLHPAIINLIYKVKGREKISIISDSVFAAGIECESYMEPDGIVRYIKDGKITLADGTIAGSAMNIYHGVKNLLKSGYPIEDVAMMASYNPAKTIGKETEIGSLEVGKRADIVILDGDYNIVRTYVDGKKV